MALEDRSTQAARANFRFVPSCRSRLSCFSATHRERNNRLHGFAETMLEGLRLRAYSPYPLGQTR